jgi:putative FmdB family regulatory protein
MPIYVYRCAQCGSETEVRQGFADAPLTTCADCSGELRRVLHPVGVIFKGSGFYSTDNRSSANGKAKSAEADGGSADTKAKDGAAKASDPKPAADKSTAATPAPASSGSTSTAKSE